MIDLGSIYLIYLLLNVLFALIIIKLQFKVLIENYSNSMNNRLFLETILFIGFGMFIFLFEYIIFSLNETNINEAIK